jgi:hypothetical protein
MKRAKGAAAAGAAILLTTAAGAHAAEGMTVAEMLQRLGDGKVGPSAMVNPRTRPAIDELKRAGNAFKAAEQRRKAAGRPSVCPPAGGRMNLTELLAWFRALPPEQQKQPVSTALPQVMRSRFPCPAS